MLLEDQFNLVHSNDPLQADYSLLTTVRQKLGPTFFTAVRKKTRNTLIDDEKGEIQNIFLDLGND